MLMVLARFPVEAGAARRDARIRFLKAQVETLRRKLGGNRVIPSPDDRARLLAIGQELDHNVADVIGIVTTQTYCRSVEELRTGRKPKRVGRPKSRPRSGLARAAASLMTATLESDGFVRPCSIHVEANSARQFT